MTFRDETIKKEYKKLHLKLRNTLKSILDNDPVFSRGDTALLAEKIFVVIEGAYYYLSLIEDEKEYNRKLKIFKEQVFQLLQT